MKLALPFRVVHNPVAMFAPDPPDASSPDALPALAALEASLGYVFTTPALLERALTHPSWAHVAAQRARSSRRGEAPVDRSLMRDNQRLEFLGDAVVELLVSERLFLADAVAREGLLTERRAALVHEARLATAARSLDLGAHLRLGPGEARSGLAERPSVLADTFEAVCAAVWLDGGLEAARSLVARVFAEDFGAAAPQRLKPAKARLQELTQRRWRLTPRYEVVASTAEGSASCRVEVSLDTRVLATGEGGSRRLAEDDAAQQALAALTAPAQESDDGTP